jgi:hypothetical protein
MATIEAATPVEAEPLTRDDILRVIDERSEALGYGPGEFVSAAESGEVVDRAETSELLVLLTLLDED